MEEKKKSKIRIMDVCIIILIVYLCYMVYTLKIENNELNAKLTKPVVSEINKVENKIESNVESNVENKTEENTSKAEVAMPTSDSTLEERVAYLEKRLQEDTQARSNYDLKIAEYIDKVAVLAATGGTEEQEIRDKIQEYFDEKDRKESEVSTGHSHIVLKVERAEDGKFVARTIFVEETNREPVDFKVTVDGRGNVLSCDYVQ